MTIDVTSGPNSGTAPVVTLFSVGQWIERMGSRGAKLLSITRTIDTKTGVCLPMNVEYNTQWPVLC